MLFCLYLFASNQFSLLTYFNFFLGILNFAFGLMGLLILRSDLLDYGQDE